MEYHKIHTMFKREQFGKNRIIEGDWTLPEFEYLQHNQWVFTEKVDGTNIRVYFENGVVTFGGRTANAQIPSQLVTRLQERFFPMADIIQNGCLYGEGYGPKIQKGGGNYRADQDFVLFDVKVGNWWLKREDVEGIAAKMGIDAVPVIGKGSLHDGIAMVRDGLMSTWGDFRAEGIVARPAVELFTRSGDRLITKIKYRDFMEGE